MMLVQEHFRQYATVAWVDFQKGDEEVSGYIGHVDE